MRIKIKKRRKQKLFFHMKLFNLSLSLIKKTKNYKKKTKNNTKLPGPQQKREIFKSPPRA